jgi:glutamate carboxypeptidase
VNVVAQNKSRQLLSYLHRHQEEMVGLLVELARVETPSHVPESQSAVQSILQRVLKDLGFRIRKIRGRRTGGQLLAIPKRRVSGQPVQLMLGHCDTVWPIGTLKEMPVHQENGKLYGPGVYDMKAGLVQIVFAIKALRELNEVPTVEPLILVNSDEEIGSPESKSTIQRLAKFADRALVAEPSLGPTGMLKTTRKGVGRFSIRVFGKASHAGLAPEKGASAILELAHVIHELFALNNPEQGVTVNVGTIDGGLRPNVVAPESRAEVDVRVATQQDANRVDKAIRLMRAVTPGTRLEVSGHMGRPPLEKTTRNEILWNLASEAAAELGIELDEGLAGGGSDGNWTSQFTATLDGLGAVGDGAHAMTEFIYVDRLAERTALLARMLLYPTIREMGS